MTIAIRNKIHFLLNDREVALSEVAADQTLLDFLRLDRKLRGTKEGCAEGDCGACTVLVGKITDNGLVYETVNACIRFTGSVDGCHIVTIEHLRGQDGGLHPVQQAMVDFHGSQCGFCTPGFVMSLYALWMQNPYPADKAIEKALQGNLCRCTGYEAIIRAARVISDYGQANDDVLKTERQQVLEVLNRLNDGARVDVSSGDQRIIIPANLDDFANIYAAEPQATIVAGSTDVGLWVTKMFRKISPVIFIGHIKGLRNISEKNGVITIGAGVTYTEAFDFIADKIPTLGTLINRIGGQQVRNMGTIGGNIANGSPIGDSPPPFIALNATLTLRKGDARRTIPLEEFFIAYGKQDRVAGEFVEAVHIPVPSATDYFAIHKVSKRHEEDITATLGAFFLKLDADNKVETVRIAYGGMAATPKRASHVEQALLGKVWTEETIETAIALYAQDYAPLSDMRASAQYRLLVSGNLLRRFFIETQERIKGTDEVIRLSRGSAA